MESPQPSQPPRDYAPALRSLLRTMLVLAVLAATAYWAWRQPFMLKPRTLWELSRMPPPAVLAMPVEGVAPGRVADSFGAPGGRDRAHAGGGIFAEHSPPALDATP
ncbi:MAG: M23 family peptidase, partial [Luteimonas sp.]